MSGSDSSDYSDYSDSSDSSDYSENSGYTDNSDAGYALIRVLNSLFENIEKNVKNLLNDSKFLKDINKWDNTYFKIYSCFPGHDYIENSEFKYYGIHTDRYDYTILNFYCVKYPSRKFHGTDKTIDNQIIFLNDAIRTILLQRRGILRELIPMLLDMIRIK